MNMKEHIAKKKINSLKLEIEYHNNLYFNQDINEISDFEYDKKLNTLIELEKKFPHLKTINSPSRRVGGTITKKFNSLAHQNPMLSLSNTYSESDIRNFDKRIKKNLKEKNIEYVESYVCNEINRDAQKGRNISLSFQKCGLIPACCL